MSISLVRSSMVVPLVVCVGWTDPPFVTAVGQGMAIYEFMDISTAHLTAGDVAQLDGGHLPFDVMTYDYGWVVSTAKLIAGPLRDGSVQDLRASGLSPEFIAAARLAGERNCWLLRFDMDADLDPDLPIGGYGMDPDEISTSGLGFS